MLDSIDDVEAGESSRSAMAAKARDGRARRVGGAWGWASDAQQRSTIGADTGRRAATLPQLTRSGTVGGPGDAQNGQSGLQVVAGRLEGAISVCAGAARVVRRVVGGLLGEEVNISS